MTSLDDAFPGWSEEQYNEQEKEKKKESFEKRFPDIPFKELRYLWLDTYPPQYAHKTGIYLCYKDESGWQWKKQLPDQDLSGSPSLAFVKAFGMEENMIC